MDRSKAGQLTAAAGRPASRRTVTPPSMSRRSQIDRRCDARFQARRPAHDTRSASSGNSRPGTVPLCAAFTPEAPASLPGAGTPGSWGLGNTDWWATVRLAGQILDAVTSWELHWTHTPRGRV